MDASENTETTTEETQAQEPAPEAEATEQTQEAAPEPETPEVAAEEPPAETEEEKKYRRSGGWQRKIERLERQLQEKDAALHRVLNGLPQTQPTEPAGEEKTPAQKAAEYLRNLAREEAREELRAEREAQRQAQAQAEFQRRTAEVLAVHPDFDDVIASVSHIRVPNELNEALLTSEHGPAIMYQLASNPAELARISALPPLAAAREIGRLEAKLASSTATPQTPKPRSAARPPAPPTSVSGSASSTRSLEDLPISEYKRAYRSGRR